MNRSKSVFILNLRRTWNFTDRINFNPDLRILLALATQLYFITYFASPFEAAETATTDSITITLRHVMCDGSSLLRPPVVEQNWS